MLGLLAVVGVALGLALGTGASGGTPGRDRVGTTGGLRTTRTAHVATQATRTRTFLGPDGIESSAIVAENRRRGTTSWRIGRARWHGSVVGFVGTTDAVRGDEVGIYVSSTAPTFRVIAYRMGWYGGDGARQVWHSRTIRGHVQPPCPVTPPVNLVSCDNWSRALRIRITSAFVPGDYLLKLVGSGGQESYLLLTVSQPGSHAAYLVVARSMTEEGWNTYGGFDFYQGTGPCTFGTTTSSYPVCNRARIVSFDRPYAEGHGASDFLTNELPLVELMERDGLDVTYTTDVAVSEDPSLLLGHRAILSLGHDETWTYPELAGLERAISTGENVGFLSAAAIVRHARLASSRLGPARDVIDYRDPTEDPLDGRGDPMEVTGNTWASPPTDFSTTPLIGEAYSGYLDPGRSAPFVAYDTRSWIYAGTDLHDGSALPGVVASDIDHLAPLQPMPSNLQVLGHSPVPATDGFTDEGTWNGDTYSDMTYYTDPTSKAGIFDSGTVNWIATLDECSRSAPSCPTRMTDKMTENLLRLFGEGPAGDRQPSVANWRSVTPAGS